MTLLVGETQNPSSVRTFVHRYELDTSARRSGRRAATSRRGLSCPRLLWWLVMVGIGLLIVGPLHDLPAETAVNRWFEARRTAGLNTLTLVLSNFGQTQYAIAVCVLVVALFWWRTKQWWLAVVPSIALGLQAVLFFTSSLLVGRGASRGRAAGRLTADHRVPERSHQCVDGALRDARPARQRITRPWLRWGLTVVCLLIPFARRDGPPLPRHAPPHRRARRPAERRRVCAPRLALPAAGRERRAGTTIGT